MPQRHWCQRCQSGSVTNSPQPWQNWDSLVVRVGTSCRVPPVRGPGASHACDQHPWGTTSHTLAVALLPAFIGNLLDDDCVADPHDLVHQVAMQTLAMGGQLA